MCIAIADVRYGPIADIARFIRSRCWRGRQLLDIFNVDQSWILNRVVAGAVHLPLHALWLDEFKKEVLSFPKGRHDDQIDALSQGLQRAFAPKPSSAGWGIYGTVLDR